MEIPCLVCFLLPAEELPVHQKQSYSLRQFNCNEAVMEQLIGFKTCQKTLPGFLPAHLTSRPLKKQKAKHTVQAHLCSTVCVSGTLMKDEEPKPCQILSSQAAKPPGPQIPVEVVSF